MVTTKYLTLSLLLIGAIASPALAEPQMSDIPVVKNQDNSSPISKFRCVSGQHIKQGRISCKEIGGTGTSAALGGIGALLAVSQLKADNADSDALKMIDTPRPINLVWNTNAVGAAAGLWQVTDDPRGKPLKTGIVSDPHRFAIDFRQIDLPDVYQHKGPFTKHFYVRVVPLNQLNQPIGLPSDSLDITFIKQS